MQALKNHRHFVIAAVLLFAMSGMLFGTSTVFARSGGTNIKVDVSSPTPSVDICGNIPGNQSTVPEGMHRDSDGTCLNSSPWETPDKARAPDPKGNLKNVPSFLEPILRPLIDAIPETVKDALRSLPPVVAQTFPYFIFLILALAAIIMMLQTASEVRATRFIILLTKRERDVAEEKDSFIALASHYLRTPLTLMEGALDTSQATNEISPEALLPLRQKMHALDSDISSVLAEVEENSALKGIKTPEKGVSGASRLLTSAFFWAPIVISIILTLLANFLLGVVGEVEIGVYNLLVEAAVYIAVSALFYSAIRTRHIKRHDRAYQKTLLRHQEVIDQARNTFITKTTLLLARSLGAISRQRDILQGTKAESYFNDGYSRFVHLLQKFNLLSEIRAGKVGSSEKFDLKAAIDEIIRVYQPKLAEKNLTIVNNVPPSTVTQRRSLFTFVFGSLIDNAIKFSNDGGTITLEAKPRDNSLTVSISDNGLEIPEDKMSQLFKPFSRGTSTLEFNYEGLGFSLFLDKIIMDYVGGQITSASSAGKDTTFTVTTPLT